MAKETWIGAEEAIDLGLIDEIIITSRAAIEEADQIFANDMPLAKILNRVEKLSKSIVNNSKPYKMENLKNHLKLDKEASEEAVVNAVKKLEDKASEEAQKAKDATEALDAAKVELEAEKENVKALNKSLAENIVDQAIEAGKFKAEKREALIDQAVENGIDGLKSMVEAIAEKPAKIIDHLKGGGSGSADNKFEGKSYREIEKSKGGEAYLNALKASNKAEFDKLFAAEYGE